MSSNPSSPHRLFIPLVPILREYRESLLSEGLPVEHANMGVRMISNEKSPLTPLAQDALDALAKRLSDEGEFTYERAYTILKEEEDLERSTAEDIIERNNSTDMISRSTITSEWTN